MTYTRKNRGVCSVSTTVTLADDGTIEDVTVLGGCSGNLQGIARAAEGMTVERLHELFAGIRCGMKHTSCPDQLAQAVAAAFGEEREEQ